MSTTDFQDSGRIKMVSEMKNLLHRQLPGSDSRMAVATDGFSGRFRFPIYFYLGAQLRLVQLSTFAAAVFVTLAVHADVVVHPRLGLFACVPFNPQSTSPSAAGNTILNALVSVAADSKWREESYITIETSPDLSVQENWARVEGLYERLKSARPNLKTVQKTIVAGEALSWSCPRQHALVSLHIIGPRPLPDPCIRSDTYNGTCNVVCEDGACVWKLKHAF